MRIFVFVVIVFVGFFVLSTVDSNTGFVVANSFSSLSKNNNSFLNNPNIGNFSGVNISSKVIMGLHNKNGIFLKNAQFDTAKLQSNPSFVMSRSVIKSRVVNNYYIVQFVGPINASWKQIIRDSGATIFNYVPNNAFVVRMNDSVKQDIESYVFVQWIGEYLPNYKLNPSLFALKNNALKTNSVIFEDVVVMLFEKKDNLQILNDIKLLGGVILESSGSILRVRIDVLKLSQISDILDVMWIEKYVQPTVFNDVAGNITNISYVWNNYGLTGEGQIIGIADTGLDTGVDDISMHDDLEGRIVALYAWWADDGDNGAADYNGHGTHVAGSVLGNGSHSSGQYSGMAPKAQLVFQALEYEGPGPLTNGGLYTPINLSLLFQESYDSGAKIHSNSWGSGDSSMYGNYTSSSQYVDGFMWNNSDMLIVFAAGNDGASGIGTVSSPGTAKNSLTVGASESSRFGGIITNIASFSSRGPTDDGRIKPDIVAPGTYIISARSSMPGASYSWGVLDSYYAYSGGTSMSTPITAGTAALVRQYYVDNESISPSAALIKATLLNGAFDIGKSLNNQGFGRLDLGESLFPGGLKTIKYYDNISLNTSQMWNVSFYLSDSESFKTTLVWTDYPGNPVVVPQLVNNLDLIIDTPNGTYFGNGGDAINNVEQVGLVNPLGGNYTIYVNGTNVPFGPQPFALVISGVFVIPEINYSYNNVTMNNSSSIIINETDSVFFNVSADQTVNYTWYVGDVSVGSNSNNYTLVTNLTDAGNVMVLVNVTNENGTDSFVWNVTVLDVLLNITDFNPVTNVTYLENTTSYFNVTTSRNTTNNSWYVGGILQNETSQKFNVSWSFDDANVYYISYNGTDGIDNVSFDWNVTVSNVNRVPVINMNNISMEKQNQTSLNLTLNVSDLDGDNLTLSVSDSNITVNGMILLFNYNVTVTEKLVVLNANDSVNSTNFTFYVNITDTIAPNVTIISPGNKSYNLLNLTFNFSFDEVVDSCIYSINGTSNNTIDCLNTTNISVVEGFNNITLWANDTLGHVGFMTQYFTVDVTPPNIYMNVSNYTTNDYLYLNVTSMENVSSCLLNWSGVNENMTVFGDVCFVNKTDIVPGSYNYFVYAVDVAGNFNVTQIQSIQVDYCYVSVSVWSSCVSGTKTRVHTLRDCTTSVESESCGTSGGSGGGGGSFSFVAEVVDSVEELNQTVDDLIVNETVENTTNIQTNVVQNMSVNETEKIIIVERIDTLKQKILDTDLSDEKKEELIGMIELAKEKIYFGNVNDANDLLLDIESKYVDDVGVVSEENNYLLYVLFFVLLFLSLGIFVYGKMRGVKKNSVGVSYKVSDVKKVKAYILTCESIGFNESQIKTKLLSVGWQKKVIDLAFVEYHENKKNK